MRRFKESNAKGWKSFHSQGEGVVRVVETGLPLSSSFHYLYAVQGREDGLERIEGSVIIQKG